MGAFLGGRLEHIKEIMELTEGYIGLCLDTCHLFTAGYDISTEKGLDRTLKRIDKLIGFERLKMMHANDSKTGLGSHIDRHEHIGKGKIGLQGMAGMVNHPCLKGLPFVLETPLKMIQDDLTNLNTIRSLRR